MSLDAVLLAAALQEHQDREGQLRPDQHYHCGGTCAAFILDTPAGRQLAAIVKEAAALVHDDGISDPDVYDRLIDAVEAGR